MHLLRDNVNVIKNLFLISLRFWNCYYEIITILLKWKLNNSNNAVFISLLIILFPCLFLLLKSFDDLLTRDKYFWLISIYSSIRSASSISNSFLEREARLNGRENAQVKEKVKTRLAREQNKTQKRVEIF